MIKLEKKRKTEKITGISRGRKDILTRKAGVGGKYFRRQFVLTSF